MSPVVEMFQVSLRSLFLRLLGCSFPAIAKGHSIMGDFLNLALRILLFSPPECSLEFNCRHCVVDISNVVEHPMVSGFLNFAWWLLSEVIYWSYKKLLWWEVRSIRPVLPVGIKISIQNAIEKQRVCFEKPRTQVSQVQRESLVLGRQLIRAKHLIYKLWGSKFGFPAPVWKTE